MLQIEEPDMNELPSVRKRNQCMWYYKKRTKKYDGWTTALEIRIKFK